MKKPAKLKKLVSQPLQRRYLMATEEERNSLLSVVEEERRWTIRKMERKGFRLEAIVADIYGLFTRGSARGKVEIMTHSTQEIPS